MPDEVDVVNNGLWDSGTHTFKVIYNKMHQLLGRNSHRIVSTLIKSMCQMVGYCLCHSSQVFRYPRLVMTNSFWVFWFITVTAHLPLGFLLDKALKLKGKEPR